MAGNLSHYSWSEPTAETFSSCGLRRWMTLGLTMLAGCSPAADRSGSSVSRAPVWSEGPSLPTPVSNNAVAALETERGVSVFSFLGMDSTRAWSGVRAAAYRWDVDSDAGWRSLPPVPGPGRLASTAQVVRGRIYLIGGYTVAEDGSERSVPDVNVFDPLTEEWSRGAPIPVPTDDAVSGVWRDSLIFLVSGWHDDGNVSAVQLYDPAADRWLGATPIPGAPVFGHTGAVVGDVIVYVDGVRLVEGRPRFALDDATWLGRIDPSDPTRIAWEAGPGHPPPALYRAAGGVGGRLALFLGGSDNPYNYDGVGYDGRPSRPLRQLLGYDPGPNRWRALPPPPVATMDHRTLGMAGGRVFLVGGMEAGQRASGRVWHASVEELLGQVRSGRPRADREADPPVTAARSPAEAPAPPACG